MADYVCGFFKNEKVVIEVPYGAHFVDIYDEDYHDWQERYYDNEFFEREEDD